MAKGWYVLHVYSGYEKRVESALNAIIEEGRLSGALFSIKVPIHDVTEMRNGKKRTVHKKMYPGYILLEMDIDKHQWKSVYSVIKNINGVTGFIGASKIKKPQAISMNEARKMFAIESGEAKNDVFIKAQFDFKHGETVKINEGPFASFTGVVEEVNREKNKLKVMVNIFGRSTPVELDFQQVEKV